jgi:hypothetical protein
MPTLIKHEKQTDDTRLDPKRAIYYISLNQ